MVTGLIAMAILADKTCYIGIGIGIELTAGHEHAVETGLGYLPASEQVYQSRNVVGYKPQVVPGVAFGVVCCLMIGCKSLNRAEVSVLVFCPQIAYTLII